MDLNQVGTLLKAKKPLDILKKIAHFNSERETGDALASVRALLSGGAVLEGTPREVTDDGYALLISGNEDVVYLETSTLIAVIVRNPGDVLKVLTDGRFFEPPPGETPSLLTLKRSFVNAQEQLSSDFGIGLKCELLDGSLSDKARFNLDRFLKSLALTLKRISADSEGKTAVEGLKEIEIQTSAQSDFSVEKIPLGLLCRLNLERDLESHLGTLQTAIEKQI